MSSIYGYSPNQGANAFFLTFSAASLLMSLIVTARKSGSHVAYGLLATMAAGLEILAYTDRLFARDAQRETLPFVQGQVALIIAPVFLTSCIYTVLHDIICVVGEEHSPIKPSLYRLILLPIDGFALAFQIIGCAVAFSDFTSDVSGPRFTDPKDAELFSQGLYIVTTGLVIQLVGLVAAAALMAVVTFRCILATREHGYTTFHRDLGYVPLPLSLRAMSLGLALATVLLLVRQFARIAELSQGDFSTDEDRFIGLESVMAVLALVLVAACHPGLLLQGIGRDARRGSAESYASSRGLVAEKRRRASSAAGRCVCAHGGQDHVHEQQRRMSSMRPSQQVMSGGLDGEEGRNSEDEANREDVEAFGHVARRPGVGGQLRSLWSLKRPRPSKAKGAWTSAGWLS